MGAVSRRDGGTVRLLLNTTSHATYRNSHHRIDNSDSSQVHDTADTATATAHDKHAQLRSAGHRRGRYPMAPVLWHG